MIMKTLEEALNYIAKLEVENKELREQLEHYKSSKPTGRKKHNAVWMASYNSFVVDYEKGLSIMEIVDKGDISRRTAYRYKAYYDELRGKKTPDSINADAMTVEELRAKLDKGYADVKAGNVEDAASAFARLRGK